jgi:5'-nucleotidase
VPSQRILITNDDGWDAPGLAALRDLASQFGDVCVVAPLEPHSYSGHRVTTDRALALVETGPGQYSLSGTPADCVRVALVELFPDINWVLAGINRGGNLGADLFTSGTVAAAREAALLGKPSIAISQYVRKGMPLDWDRSRDLAQPVVVSLMAERRKGQFYWNVNLPHLDSDAKPSLVHCEPDNQPLDIRFRRDADQFHYCGDYRDRPRTRGRDVDHCFQGSITVSCLRL